MSEVRIKRDFYPDVVRCVAVFLVILVHVSAALLIKQWDELPFDQWNYANFYDSLARPCVPMFIMLSGSLLLDRQESIKAFFKKRFSKLMIPFVFWVAAYVLWRLFYINADPDADFKVDNIVRMVLNGSASYHLWYLYMIVGLYLITPLLRKWVVVMNEGDFRYFFGLWYVIYALIPFILYLERVYGGYYFYIDVKLHMTWFIGYYMMGYYLKFKVFDKKTIRICWWTLILSTLLTFFGSWIFNVSVYNAPVPYSLQMVLYEYTSVTAIPASVALYIIIMYYGSHLERTLSEGFKSLIKRGGRLSFGIYLCHVMILDLMSGGGLGFELHGSSFYSAFAIPITTVVTFVLSYLICWLASCAPVLKYVIVEKASPKTIK